MFEIKVSPQQLRIKPLQGKSTSNSSKQSRNASVFEGVIHQSESNILDSV